jgi:hypothetical protein
MEQKVRKSAGHGQFRGTTTKIPLPHLPTFNNPQNNDRILSIDRLWTHGTCFE